MKNRILIGLVSAIIIFGGYYLVFHKPSGGAKTTYQFIDYSADIPINLKTWDCAPGWVKMVIFNDSSSRIWKLNSNGDTIWTDKVISDTFYLLRTADQRLPFRDSAGKPIIDPQTKQPMFYLTWNDPMAVPKDVIVPLKPIPSRFLPQLYNSIPQPVKDTSKPKLTTTGDSTIHPDTSKLHIPKYVK